MVFSARQLEELENIHDVNISLDDDNEESNNDESGESAMAWRLAMVEEAANNVKRSKGRPVNPSITYPLATLLFDSETRRFARVKQSVPGYLKLVYLSGGDREYGQLNPEDFVRDYGHMHARSSLLDQLEIEESVLDDLLVRFKVTPAPEPAEDLELANIQVESALSSSPSDSDHTPDAPVKAKSSAKRAPKRTQNKVDAAAKKAKLNDINEYIKKNFMAMSNKELAQETGLSPHTIRRKLGEWGLKRKKA